MPGIAGGGLYLVVDKADVPIYVGEAGNFAARWSNPKSGRLIELAQLGLPQPCAPVRAYFGRIAVDRTTRKALEHTVIRTLLNGGLGDALTNVRSRAEFRVRTGVRVDGVLPATLAARVRFADSNKARYYRNNSLDIPDAAAYEIAVGG